MLIKEKSRSLLRNLTFGSFGKLLIVFSTKVNLIYSFYSAAWMFSFLHLIKQNSLLKSFPFPSKTNLKLYIYVTLKIVKNIMNLDSSKSSGPDCIPVVVLKWWNSSVSVGVLFSRLL